MSEMQTQSRTSPIVVIAAVAVIIFSAVGVGVMTGVIPSSVSKPAAPEAATKAPETKAAPAVAERPAPKRSQPARAKEPARVAVNEPARTAAPRVCANCGTIDAVNVVEQKGEGSGLGAVAGGVVGGVLGSQVGQGRGNTAATVVGAAGGAYAGHEIEKRMKATKQYNVSVRMEDGSMRSFTFETEPGFAVGEKVRVVDGKLVRS